MQNLQNFTLDNGSRLFVLPVVSANSAVVMATIKAGPRFDPVGKEGLSHFTEHMLFRGTKKHTSRLSLVEELERNGSQAEAFSYHETNKYWIKCPKERMHLALENLTERIYTSLIKEEDIEMEKRVIKEERSILFSNPEKLIWEYWNQALWGGEALGRVYLGSERSINSFTRKDIVDFIHSYHTPHNISYFVGGNIDIEGVVARLNLLLAKFKSQENKKRLEEQNFESKNSRRVRIAWNHFNDININLGFRTVPESSDLKEVFELISSFLGGGMSSKLRQIMMEPGYTYSVEAVTENLSDAGYLAINFTTNKTLVKKVLKMIYATISDLSKTPLTNDQLNLVKGFCIGQLKTNIETPLDWAFYYSGQIAYIPDKIKTLEEKIQKIDKIGPDVILKTARKYLRGENFYLAAAGNIRSKEIVLPGEMVL